MSKYCPNNQCTLSNFPTMSNYCTECGAENVDRLTCDKCGKSISPNSKFCGECGRPSK